MRRDVRRRAKAKAHRAVNQCSPSWMGALLLIRCGRVLPSRYPRPGNRQPPLPQGHRSRWGHRAAPRYKRSADREAPSRTRTPRRPDRLGARGPNGHRRPGEILAVYELTQDPGAPKQLIEVCRPLKRTPRIVPGGTTSTRADVFAERDWERFEDALANAFPEHESEPQPTSPLLETIAVLAARHVPGKRGDERFKVHLVVFSDLLQHTPRFSHYGPYPDAKDMRHSARDLLTDLTGAQSEPLPTRTAQVREVAEQTSLLLVDRTSPGAGRADRMARFDLNRDPDRREAGS